MTPDDFYSLFDKRNPPRETPHNVTQLDPARASRYAAKALTSECENVAVAAVGTRNHTLNVAAFSVGQLVAAGHLERDAAWSALTDAARTAGLADTEIEATLTSGLNAGQEQPRVVPELPPLPEPTVLEVPDLTATEDANFWSARPLLQHLHTFALARMVAPWAVLGVTLARIVTATSHQVCIPPIIGGKASLNLFVGLVGPSGSGKGAAEQVAAEALDVGHLVSHNVGSGEGIAHGYKHRVKGELRWNDDEHAVLFSVPEIDSLAAQGDRKGATLMPQLRSGWTGEQLGFGYADPTKRILIEAHQYRLCLVAGVQPGRAACLLDDSDGGTPQRFLWLPAVDPTLPDVEPSAPSPTTWHPPPLSHLVSIGGVRIEVCQTAQKVIKDNRRERARGNGDALDGHALLCQLKTAAALGIAEGRYSVTDEDWQLAEVIARKSAATRAAVTDYLRGKQHEANYGRAEAEATRSVIVAEKVADAAVKRVAGRLIRHLRGAEEPVTRGYLRRDLASRDRAYIDEALERLVDAGQVAKEGDEFRACC